MWRIPILAACSLGAAGALAMPLAAQQPAGVRPAEVTAAAIAAGDTLFHGSGNCGACHGAAGEGTAEGPALTRGQWQLGPGTYEWLVHMTRHAGVGGRSREDDPRPMRGPTILDSVQVRAVAAYVWSISRDMRPGPARPTLRR